MNKDIPLFQNQPYQKYSPNVFDDSLSLYEQTISFIEFLNQVIENSNEVTEEIILIRKQFEEFKDNLDNRVEDFKDDIENRVLPENLEIILNRWIETGKIDTVLIEKIEEVKQNFTTQLAQTDTRIDTLISLPSGGTTNDARLEDIAVGTDGFLYPSPGSAVRAVAKGIGISDSFGDYIVGSYNLINPDTITKGKYVQDGGLLLTTTAGGVSDFREVEIGENYALFGASATNNILLVCYDSGKNPIRTIYNGSLSGSAGSYVYRAGYTHNANSGWLVDDSQANVRYIKVNIGNNLIEQMLVVGTTYPSSYTPYLLEIKSEKLDSTIKKMIVKNSSSESGGCSAWGDSKSQGDQDETGVTYPNVLQELLTSNGSEIVVNNQGLGGETTTQIMGRQGSYPLTVQPFTIPESLTEVQISINLSLRINATSSINPVIINGVSGVIRKDWSDVTNKIYFFKRSVSGSVVQVKRPTQIITNNMMNNKNDIMLIDIGCNGGYGSIEEWIQQIKLMVDYSKCKEYIVFGLAINQAYSFGSTNESYTTLEDKFLRAFGNRYINLRKYYVEYGLLDAGLTPTTLDNENIANNIPPSSLFVEGDTIHENKHGYKIKAKLAFDKLKELNII